MEFLILETAKKVNGFLSDLEVDTYRVTERSYKASSGDTEFQQNLYSQMEDELENQKRVLYRSPLMKELTLRKVRISRSDNAKGKSSGYRCIVVVVEEKKLIIIIVLDVFTHQTKDNIDEKEKKKYRKLVDTIATILKKDKEKYD